MLVMVGWRSEFSNSEELVLISIGSRDKCLKSVDSFLNMNLSDGLVEAMLSI